MITKLATDPHVFDRAITKSYKGGAAVGIPMRRFIKHSIRAIVTFFVICFFGTINFFRGFFSEEI